MEKENRLQVFASISPWLPLLNDYLSTIVVLEEKAAELYRLSLLEKPNIPQKSRETVLGVWKAGKSLQVLHEHLIRCGFQRRSILTTDTVDSLSYYREDLGSVRFVCPQIRSNQRPASIGLTAIPKKRTAFLLENPHFVDVSYLGKNYEVLIPQVGRFILDKGLKLKIGRNLDTEKIYESSQNLLMILDLLVSHEEMQEETLNDFLEIRPPALVKEFVQLLKQSGPGSVLWDSAQRFYLEKYPNSKIVSLTKWYWEFLPTTIKFLEKQKNSLN
jgi:hypothetical protein